MTQPEPHSQLYFTDARDHWWHDDYVGLLARRTGMDRARRVLDVGSGQGHFSRLWAPHLPEGFEVVGVEPEARSRAVADERCRAFAAARGLRGSFRFVEGQAERLPFEDGEFDAVICQTVLIHLADPARAISEMTRVVRPGGLVLAAEPNNLGDAQRFAALGPGADLTGLTREVEFQARCVKGKAALGLGWNNLGVHLPALFAGLEGVRYFQNDRPWVMAPPYGSPQERAALEDLRDLVARGIYGWSRDEARRYFVAGGGDEASFEVEYEAALVRQRAELAQVERGAWCELSGVIMLVAVGTRAPG